MTNDALHATDILTATELSGSDGLYKATLSKEWRAGYNTPYGGYISAILLRAAIMEASNEKRPVSFTGFFHRPAPFGEVKVNVLYEGKRTSVTHVAMTDIETKKSLVDAYVRSATEADGLEIADSPMPNVPGPDSAVDSSEFEEYALITDAYSMMSRLELRLASYNKPATAKEPLTYVWVKYPGSILNDSSFMRSAIQVIAPDGACFWPLIQYNGIPGVHHEYLTITLSQNIQLIRPSKPEKWLLYESHIFEAHRGLLGTNARVWNEEGELVCTAITQMLCVSVGKDWAKG